jgi:hypothetical protein
MRITFSHTDAGTAAAIVNAVTNAYLQVLDVEQRQDMARLSRLEKALNDAREKTHAELSDIGRQDKDADELANGVAPVGRSSPDTELTRMDLEKEIDSLRVELRSPRRVVSIQAADIPKQRNTEGRLSKAIPAALLGCLLPLTALTLWNARGRWRWKMPLLVARRLLPLG